MFINILEYLKKRKNRYTLITVNVVMSLVLSLFSVYLDGAMGSASLNYIYAFQVVCFLNWAIAFSLIIWNVFAWAGKKIKK